MPEDTRKLPERVDALVIGGGMAGLAAGAAIARSGGRVAVIEKGEHPGGSAALSVGMFWAMPDYDTLRRRVPLGEADLGRAVVEDYPEAVEEIRGLGVPVGERVSGVMSVGVGHSIDVHALLEHEFAVIERGGGLVSCGSTASRLLSAVDGAAIGAEVLVPGGESFTVRADATILATGGFQGDPDLVGSYMGPNAYHMLLRSNPGSVGDGLQLGLAAGGATSQAMSSFYGHLVPSPLESLDESQYMPLAQYHSNHCVLINTQGRRFCDETQGDEVNNQALLAQPGARGVLVCDERVRRTHVVSEPFPNAGLVDRFEEARQAGARFTSAESLYELADRVSKWGIDGEQMEHTLQSYSAAVRGERASPDAPMPEEPEPLVEPPFYALEVQPAITFTYGGLSVDADGRVLDRDGSPVTGLWAAGVDAGGLSNWTYAGGLAPAFITGRRAAAAVLSTLAAADEEQIRDQAWPSKERR